jgi:hypothetical protein
VNKDSSLNISSWKKRNRLLQKRIPSFSKKNFLEDFFTSSFLVRNLYAGKIFIYFCQFMDSIIWDNGEFIFALFILGKKLSKYPTDAISRDAGNFRCDHLCYVHIFIRSGCCYCFLTYQGIYKRCKKLTSWLSD